MPVLAIAAIATAVVSTGISIYSSQQAASATSKAAADQRQMENLQSARQQRDAIRTSRIAAANVTQSAENQGAANTSATAGGVGSIQSQNNANLSFLDQYNSLADAASIQLGKAATFRAQGQTASAVGGLAEEVFANSSKIGSAAKSVFGGG